MTEPHMLRIDSRDLADLIDERERLADSLAECTREAMNSADEWRAEVNRANAVNAGYRQQLRTVQELLGYDQPDLLSEADLTADIRALVEYKLTRPDPWQPAVVIHPPTQPVAVAALAASLAVGARTAFDAGAAEEARFMETRALDNLPGWSHDQAGLPVTPRIEPPAAPQPRTWRAGDPEPPVAGPCAVWGVVNELGDLYRPQPRNDQHGAFWTDNTGAEWTWTGVLVNGPVTEAFQPSPEPRTDTAETPAGEALNEPVTSDNTANTDIPAEMEGSW